MELGHQGFARKVLLNRNDVDINFRSTPATPNVGTHSVGDGPWDGLSTGFFAGSSLGTIYAANAASGYAGNLIDLQIAGNTKFTVDNLGNAHLNNPGSNVGIYANGALWISTGNNSATILNIHSGSLQSNPGITIQSAGSNANTPLTVNGLSGQSVAIQAWKESGGNTICSVGSTGFIVVNPLAGFSGNLLDLQVAGTSRFSVDATGQATLARPALASANTALLMLGSGGFAGGAPNFVGSASGNIIGINATSFTGNFLICEIDSTNFFSIGADGRITSVSNSQWGINQNSSLGANNDFFSIDNAGGNGALTGGAGNQQSFFSIRPNINQSSTAAYTGLEVNVTETTTGSGAKLLLDLQVGGVSKFSVSNTGTITPGVSIPAAIAAESLIGALYSFS